MRTIWKYKLEMTDRQILGLPQYAQILDIQVQHGTIQLWAMVDPDKPIRDRVIRIIGTGHPIPDGEQLEWYSSIQLMEGALVFHVFELLER